MQINIFTVGLKHSSYDTITKHDFNIIDLFIYLKNFGYSKFKKGYKYIEAIRNKNNYLDIYFRDTKNSNIDNLTFHYPKYEKA